MDNREERNDREEAESVANDVDLRRLALCQRLALLGRLSTSIAHEINNHLTGVSGYAQLLLGNARAAEFTRELDKILSSANLCRDLIEGMRQVGRFGDGEKEFNNVNIIIASALDLIRHQFEKGSLRIVKNLSDGVRALEVDTPALEQVFLNIMQNSYEALADKGTTLTISTSEVDARVVATFDDDGPGLSRDALANLFVPFFTTKAHLKCPGLGLAAARTIVEEHGGSIEVDNSPSGGASVSIALPIDSASG